ncbi:TPA: hypothetical protein ACSC0T_001849, partial [Campylobacter jejuni]
MKKIIILTFFVVFAFGDVNRT